MIVKSQVETVYLADPEFSDEVFYAGELIKVEETGDTFFVAFSEIDPKTEEHRFSLMGTTGNEHPLQAGDRVSYGVYSPRRPGCCDFGRSLTWMWPKNPSGGNLGLGSPGWAFLSRTLNGFVYRVVPDVCHCGAKLPDPGVAARVEGRRYLLAVLNAKLTESCPFCGRMTLTVDGPIQGANHLVYGCTCSACRRYSVRRVSRDDQADWYEDAEGSVLRGSKPTRLMNAWELVDTDFI